MAPAAHPPIPVVRILVIDDDEDIPVLVRASLATDAYVVDWVPDYDSAIEAVRNHEFGALLIDYRLGDRDGIRLLTELQIRGHGAAMIILTSADDPQVDAAALGAGAADFILKSEVTQARLERAIRYARERTGQLTSLRRAAEAAAHDASIDPLTGLANRRAFDLDLARLVDGDLVGGLIFIDLDGLKAINDCHGHAAGDAAIQTIAGGLRTACRTADATYRIGGDELAAIIVGPGTAEIGRRIERSLSRLSIEDFLISASVGSAERRPDDTMAALFARADADLYARKRIRRCAT